MKKTILVFALGICLLSALSGCSNSMPADETESGADFSVPVTSADRTDEQGTDEAQTSALPERESEPEIIYEPFRGVEKDENPINTVNCKEFRPSVFCYGGGNAFFMWNGTVYRHDGETTEALFERNAYNLNYKDGKLYFIENDSFDMNGSDYVHIEGLLYCYDLQTGAFESLTDFPVSQPVVTDRGIFYTDYATADEPDPPTGICRLNENGVSERLYDGMNYIEYSGYRLKNVWGEEEKVIFFRGDEAYLPENVHPYWDCVSGDYYYYRSEIDKSLNRLSMLTGEITTLKSYESQYSDPLFDDFVCQDYTVLNDEIYFIDDYSALRKYDEATGACIQINIKYAFRYLCADDQNIYGIGCEREEESMVHTYHFMKLTLNGGTVEGEILV